MAGESVCRLVLRVEVDDLCVEYRREIAGHEPLDSVLRWLRDVELSRVADLLQQDGEAAELVDETTYPPRPLSSWSKTMQASGLWPSARLLVRRSRCVEMTVKGLRAETRPTTIASRIDETWSQVAARAFFAFASQEFADVSSSDAPRCRLVYNGEVLRSDDVVGSRFPRKGAVLVLCRPPPQTTEKKNTRAERPNLVATCRICLCEGAVRSASSAPADDPNWWSGRVSDALSRLGRGERVDWSTIFPRSAPDRLFSPCRCSGSMRYVHVSCLQRWRASAPRTQSVFRCDQCGYQYRLKRTAFVSYLCSEKGALAVAVALLSSAIQAVGLCLQHSLSPSSKRTFYRSLHLRRPLSSQTAQIACLGSAGVGLACFSLYAVERLALAAYHCVILRRRPRAQLAAAEPAVFLAIWILAELRDLGRSRALAVVGFLVCGQLVFSAAIRLARTLALKIGDSVLDVSPSDDNTPPPPPPARLHS